MKVIAFGASTSPSSINKKLAAYTLGLMENVDGEVLDLRDYTLPIYSEDLEQASGIPAAAQAFFQKITDSDALIISLAEHNGSYTAAYKNLFDWCSRINSKVFQGKPMVLLSTSPGPGGASSVLGAAVNSAPYFNGDLRGNYSVASFYDVYDPEADQITGDDINNELKELVKKLF